MNTNDQTKVKMSDFTYESIQQDEEECIRSYARGSGHGLRILFFFYRKHYGRLLLAILLYAVKAIPMWVMPVVTANIIDAVTKGGDHTVQVVVCNLVILVLLIAFNIPINYIYIRQSSLARRHVEASLRGAMIRKLQRLSMSFHKQTRSGKIQSKIMRDVESVETLSSQVFNSLVETALNMFVPLAIVLTRNWLVFLLFLVMVPISALSALPFRRKMREQNRRFRKEIEETSSDVLDMEELVPVTRAHALEDREVSKLTARILQVARRGFQLDVLHSVFGSINWVIMMLFRVLCLCVSAFLALKGRISIGDIALYQTYFATIVSYTAGLVALIPLITKGTESIHSIGEVLTSGDEENYEGKKKLVSLRGDFRFDNVSFHYADDDRPVLSNLNLHVKQGETIALVGESGSGKSTIVSLVIGYYAPTTGTMCIDDVDVSQLDMRGYREHIAVVPQNTILFSGTIRENITYGRPDVSEEELRRAIEASNLAKTIAGLPDGLDTTIGEHGDKLSGGQRQRIAIARALIRDPDVILFDEATSALDTVSEAEIQQAIDNLTQGRTTFIVAHRLSTIRNADKIAVIEHGRCVEYGTYDELMEKKGAFYTYRQMQA